MANYLIYTDSGCDISPELLKEWGVPHSSLTFQFDGDDTVYSNDDMPVKVFYDRMRAGGIAKTSAVNVGTFLDAFEPILKEGVDILYLGFSSGLSTTYNSGEMAAAQLREKYPERKILTVDTLAACAGQGLLVKMAVDKKNEGASIEEVAAYIEEIKLKMCHFVTVNDLVYLKRGGRISPTAAFFGNALGIKPMIKMDNEGKLTNYDKVRGRKNAIKELLNKYDEYAVKKDGVVYIAHADCDEEVAELAKSVKKTFGAKVEVITSVGTVIGAHTGPGVLVLFFIGKER